MNVIPAVPGAYIIDLLPEEANLSRVVAWRFKDDEDENAYPICVLVATVNNAIDRELTLEDRLTGSDFASEMDCDSNAGIMHIHCVDDAAALAEFHRVRTESLSAARLKTYQI